VAVVNHSGTRLVADLADVTGLSAAMSGRWHRCAKGIAVLTQVASRSTWR
jgi:hypothetical protein